MSHRNNDSSGAKEDNNIARLTPLNNSSNSSNRNKRPPPPSAAATAAANSNQHYYYQNSYNYNNNNKQPPPPLCHFYVLHGQCRYGDNCAYSHELPEGVGFVEARKQTPCRYYALGTCRFGDRCCFKHEDSSNNNEMIQQATDDAAVKTFPPPQNVASATSVDNNINNIEEKICGICLEDIANNNTNTNKKFGLLSCCDHVFCMDCLMNWRVEGSEDAEDRRCCPTCRKHSDYVVPSHVFPISEQHKQAIVDQYKTKLSLIPCKRFKRGILGSCAFGSDCFFAHLDEDGVDIKSYDESMKELREKRLARQRQRRPMHSTSESDAILEDLLYSMMVMRIQQEQERSRRTSTSSASASSSPSPRRARSAAAPWIDDDDDDDNDDNDYNNNDASEIIEFLRWLADGPDDDDDDDDDDSDWF